MRAYVLINVRPGKVRDVVSSVIQFEGVRHADACWGLPDVFAYVETRAEKSLNTLVMDRIQKLEGVDRTETHIVVELVPRSPRVRGKTLPPEVLDRGHL